LKCYQLQVFSLTENSQTKMTSIHSCVAACVTSYAIYRVVSEDVIPHPLCQLLISGVARKVLPTPTVLVIEDTERVVRAYVADETYDNLESLADTLVVDRATDKVVLSSIGRHNHNRAAKAAVAVVRKRMPLALTEDNKANRLTVHLLVVKELERLHVRAGDIARVAALATTFFFIPTSFDQEIMDLENASVTHEAIDRYLSDRSTTVWSRLVPAWLKPSQRGRVDHRQ